MVLVHGASNNSIGQNTISGNLGNGISMYGAGTDHNSVQGNKIGTDGSGTVALPNARDGVVLGTGASNNTIGGAETTSSNLISGNSGSGVIIQGQGTCGNSVTGNVIGNNARGQLTIPNGGRSVIIRGGASGNWIGGTLQPGNNWSLP